MGDHPSWNDLTLSRSPRRCATELISFLLQAFLLQASRELRPAVLNLWMWMPQDLRDKVAKTPPRVAPAVVVGDGTESLDGEVGGGVVRENV